MTRLPERWLRAEAEKPGWDLGLLEDSAVVAGA
jgi:hypothetical protein